MKCGPSPGSPSKSQRALSASTILLMNLKGLHFGNGAEMPEGKKPTSKKEKSRVRVIFMII